MKGDLDSYTNTVTNITKISLSSERLDSKNHENCEELEKLIANY